MQKETFRTLLGIGLASATFSGCATLDKAPYQPHRYITAKVVEEGGEVALLENPGVIFDPFFISDNAPLSYSLKVKQGNEHYIIDIEARKDGESLVSFARRIEKGTNISLTSRALDNGKASPKDIRVLD